MKFKATVCMILVVCLLLLSACSGGGAAGGSSVPSPSGGSSGDSTFSLLYCANDTLNPYTAVTRSNRQLGMLLYDPLVKFDPSFNLVNVIAQSIVMNGTHCAITLKNINFSDGTRITAEDVIYSINKAREGSAEYATQLSAITSMAAASETSVSLILSAPDPMFASMLDFPIIKHHSDTLRDADNAELPPIGCGRYVISDDKTVLNANPNYHGGALNIEQIFLVNAPDDEAIKHNIEVGAVDFYYSDLSDGVVPKMSGVNADVHLMNLVYLGVNMKGAQLSAPELRYAISAALDRTDIADTAYFGAATAAGGPFPQSYAAFASYQTIEAVPNTSVAIANLEKLGYNGLDTEGYRINAYGNRLSLSLLCNSDNSRRVEAAEMIKKQLAEVGIFISVNAVSWESYSSLLKSGNFDLFIGEICLPNDLDLSAVAVEGGAVAYGVVNVKKESVEESSAPAETTGGVSSEDTGKKLGVNFADALASYKNSQISLADALGVFFTDMPIIPLLHRSGTAVFSAALNNPPTSTVSDLFFGIEKTSFK